MNLLSKCFIFDVRIYLEYPFIAITPRLTLNLIESQLSRSICLNMTRIEKKCIQMIFLLFINKMALQINFPQNDLNSRNVMSMIITLEMHCRCFYCRNALLMIFIIEIHFQ